MTGNSTSAEALQTLQLIRDAFADRAPPTILTSSKQLTDVEYAEVMSFDQLDWQAVRFDLIERCADAVFWFAPEAFCYYLPGFLCAGLQENRTDTNTYDALIGMLDRSPEPDYWDDFFLPRWTLLSVGEIDAVSAWARWLLSVDPSVAGGKIAQRVQDTLTLLRWNAESTKTGLSQDRDATPPWLENSLGQGRAWRPRAALPVSTPYRPFAARTENPDAIDPIPTVLLRRREPSVRARTGGIAQSLGPRQSARSAAKMKKSESNLGWPVRQLRLCHRESDGFQGLFDVGGSMICTNLEADLLVPLGHHWVAEPGCQDSPLK